MHKLYADIRFFLSTYTHAWHETASKATHHIYIYIYREREREREREIDRYRYRFMYICISRLIDRLIDRYMASLLYTHAWYEAAASNLRPAHPRSPATAALNTCVQSSHTHTHTHTHTHERTHKDLYTYNMTWK